MGTFGSTFGDSLVHNGSLLNLTSPEYKAIYDAVSVKPSNQIALAQNAFVKALVDGGVWSKFACIIATSWGMPNASDALFWLNNIARKATQTPTAPTYSPLMGFTGNGTSSYIDSTFNPSVDGAGLYTQNNCSAGFYFTNERITDNTGGSGISIGTNGICIYPQYSGTTGYMRCQSDYNLITKEKGTNRLFTIIRKSNSLVNIYQNKVILGSDITKASAALQNATIHLLHTNGDASSFMTDTIGLFFAGAELTQSDINLIIDKYGELQMSLKLTVLVDSCDGNIINTDNWEITNTHPNSIKFYQNDGLIMDEVAVASLNLHDNIIKSKVLQNYGTWEFNVLNNKGQMQNFSSFGLWVDNTNRIEIYRDYAGTDFFVYRIFKGISTEYSVNTNISDLATFKIVVSPFKDISLFALINDAWVQIGVTQNKTLGQMALFMASTGYNLCKTTIRDIKIG